MSEIFKKKRKKYNNSEKLHFVYEKKEYLDNNNVHLNFKAEVVSIKREDNQTHRYNKKFSPFFV